MYTIYTKDNCPFCDKAKNLLTQKQIAFTSLKLGVDFTREELLAKIPSARTMPQIMVGETLIGGYKELESSFVS